MVKRGHWPYDLNYILYYLNSTEKWRNIHRPEASPVGISFLKPLNAPVAKAACLELVGSHLRSWGSSALYLIHTFLILTLVSYPWLNFAVVGMEILIKIRSRCHYNHHKGKKGAFSVVMRGAPIFQNYCMENDEICLLRLARAISVVFGLISLCIDRRPVLMLYNHGRIKIKHHHECNFCRGHLVID